MYLIILGHGLSHPDYLLAIVYGVSVPLFFFLSGYLYRDKSWKEVILKQIVYLWLPVYLLCLIKNIIRGYDSTPLFDIIWETTKYCMTGFHGIGQGWGLSEGWFVYTLIVLNFLRKGLGLKRLTIFMPILMLMAVLLNYKEINPCNGLANVTVSVPFYVAGNWVSIKKEWLANLFKKNYNKFFVFIFATVIYTSLAILNGAPWMYCNGYGKNILLFIFVGLTGILLLYGLTSVMVKIISPKLREWITLMAQGNLVVLCLHFPLIRFRDQWELIFYSLILYIAFIPIIYFLRKYIPFFIGMRKNKKQPEPIRA